MDTNRISSLNCSLLDCLTWISVKVSIDGRVVSIAGSSLSQETPLCLPSDVDNNDRLHNKKTIATYITDTGAYIRTSNAVP